MKTENIFLYGVAAWLGYKILKPTETATIGAKKLTYEILVALPFETYGYREAEILRHFEKIKKVQNGIYEVFADNGNSFQITYGHEWKDDFVIIG